ncbi:hypothetical protein HZS_6852 [Henneguya salminicola]|nr:hypothetical protein HZS_6852 [Henneguya salminicola]
MDRKISGNFQITSAKGDHLELCSQSHQEKKILIDLHIDIINSERTDEATKSTDQLYPILEQTQKLYQKVNVIFDLFSQTKEREVQLLQTNGNRYIYI